MVYQIKVLPLCHETNIINNLNKLNIMEKRIYNSFAEVTESMKNVEYIVIEKDIPYDWDDYGVAADILYSLKEKKIIVDYYGHGSDPIINENNSVDFSAIKSFDKCMLTDMAKAILQRINIEPNNRALKVDTCLFNIDLNVKCHVIGGRNKTDNAVFLYAYTKRNQYNSYYNEERAKIYYCDKNVIMDIPLRYVVFQTVDDSLFNKLIDIVSQKIKFSAHIIAYQISYSACDTRYAKNDINRLILDCYDKITVDLDGVTDVAETRKKAKIMAKLAAWANEKLTDKTEEEKREICERIYIKKYKNR